MDWHTLRSRDKSVQLDFRLSSGHKNRHLIHRFETDAEVDQEEEDKKEGRGRRGKAMMIRERVERHRRQWGGIDKRHWGKASGGVGGKGARDEMVEVDSLLEKN